jgi:hypothetical protein
MDHTILDTTIQSFVEMDSIHYMLLYLLYFLSSQNIDLDRYYFLSIVSVSSILVLHHFDHNYLIIGHICHKLHIYQMLIDSY